MRVMSSCKYNEMHINNSNSSETHLNSFDKIAMYFFNWLLGIDTDNEVSVFLQNMLHETAVFKQLLFDIGMLIFRFVLKSAQNCFVFDVFSQNEVELVCNWVESSLFKFLVNEVVTHVKSQNQTWLQIQFF